MLLKKDHSLGELLCDQIWMDGDKNDISEGEETEKAQGENQGLDEYEDNFASQNPDAFDKVCRYNAGELRSVRIRDASPRGTFDESDSARKRHSRRRQGILNLTFFFLLVVSFFSTSRPHSFI
jgi:hypothetical protein